ncbi:MAG: acyl-CoA thioesterase [Spirochaetota bacterium]|jgi:acyl-CoA thioester hydrolase
MYGGFSQEGVLEQPLDTGIIHKKGEGGCVTQQRPFHIDLPITVKTYDVDFMGIVSNITYVRWLEDLRLCVLEAHYPLQKLLSELIVPVITQTHIEYKRPIRMHDRVNGSIWMEKFDSSGWMINAEFLVNGKYAATAKQGGVFVNLGTMKPANPPEGLQNKFDEESQRL